MYMRPKQKLVTAMMTYSFVVSDSFSLSDGSNANCTSVMSVKVVRMGIKMK